MSEIIFLSVFVLLIVLLGYWAVTKVFTEEIQIPKITKIKIAFIVPFSLLFPLAMFKVIDAYALLIYLITIPISVLLIKKLSGDESFTFSSAFTIYKAVAGKILFVIFILGAISRVIMFIIKN
jgi:hypothetical protein